MRNKGRGLIWGDWLLTRHGHGDDYATDGLFIYRKIIPGCYYKIKTTREAIEETIVATVRMGLFVLAAYLLGAFDQLLTLRGFAAWLCIYFLTHFGAKK